MMQMAAYVAPWLDHSLVKALSGGRAAILIIERRAAERAQNVAGSAALLQGAIELSDRDLYR